MKKFWLLIIGFLFLSVITDGLYGAEKYGFVKGGVARFGLEPPPYGEWPHYQIFVTTPEGEYETVTNLKILTTKKVEYKLIENLSSKCGFGDVFKASDGFHELQKSQCSGAGDYVRNTALFRPDIEWQTASGDEAVSTMDNLLANMKVFDNVYVFGAHYTDGDRGIHKVHYEQGDQPGTSHAQRNMPWQDGFILLEDFIGFRIAFADRKTKVYKWENYVPDYIKKELLESGDIEKAVDKYIEKELKPGIKPGLKPGKESLKDFALMKPEGKLKYLIKKWIIAKEKIQIAMQRRLVQVFKRSAFLVKFNSQSLHVDDNGKTIPPKTKTIKDSIFFSGTDTVNPIISVSEEPVKVELTPAEGKKFDLTVVRESQYHNLDTVCRPKKPGSQKEECILRGPGKFKISVKSYNWWFAKYTLKITYHTD